MDEAIEQYFETPEQMKDYLSFMSRFYQYSPRNISLINEQFQGAKAVGSFKFWKEKGFSVKKDEKGIEVLVPNQTVPKFKDANGKWKSMKYATKEEKEKIQNGELEQRKGKLYFSVGHVFDISQTTAKASDLPKIFPNRWMEGNVDDYDAMIKALHKVAKKVDVTVGRPIGELGAAKGAFYYAVEKEGNGHIGLNPRNSELQNVKTLIHELAHAKLHHMKHENHHKLNDAEKEFQAEMTAYTVASYFGIDTSDYSLSYLANWTKGKEMKDKSTLLKEVHETSVEFIETMEEILVKREKEEEKELESNENPLEKFVEWNEQILRRKLNTKTKGANEMNKETVSIKMEFRGLEGKEFKNVSIDELRHIVLESKEEMIAELEGKEDIDLHNYVVLSDGTRYKDYIYQCNELMANEDLTIDEFSQKFNQMFKGRFEVSNNELDKTLHWYEMTSRPISPGAQPDGFIEWDEEKGKYGVVAYEKALTEKEMAMFQMKEWNEEKEQTKAKLKEKVGLERE